MHNGPSCSALTAKDGIELVILTALLGVLLIFLDILPRVFRLSEGGKYRSDAKLAGHGMS